MSINPIVSRLTPYQLVHLRPCSLFQSSHLFLVYEIDALRHIGAYLLVSRVFATGLGACMGCSSLEALLKHLLKVVIQHLLTIWKQHVFLSFDGTIVRREEMIDFGLSTFAWQNAKLVQQLTWRFVAVERTLEAHLFDSTLGLAGRFGGDAVDGNRIKSSRHFILIDLSI